MRLLLEYGAAPNDGDETPLHKAVLGGNLDVLLEHGADPNRWIKHWSYPAGLPCASPTSRAAEEGNAEVLARLLRRVRKVTEPARRLEDFGALAVAASPEIATQLLAAGAKPTRSALPHALRSSWWEVAGTLLARGAPLDAEGPEAVSALAPRQGS